MYFNTIAYANRIDDFFLIICLQSFSKYSDYFLLFGAILIAIY